MKNLKKEIEKVIIEFYGVRKKGARQAVNSYYKQAIRDLENLNSDFDPSDHLTELADQIVHYGNLS